MPLCLSFKDNPYISNAPNLLESSIGKSWHKETLPNIWGKESNSKKSSFVNHHASLAKGQVGQKAWKINNLKSSRSLEASQKMQIPACLKYKLEEKSSIRWWRTWHAQIYTHTPEISESGFTVSRPRLRFSFIESQFCDRGWDFFLVVSTTRLRPRLFFQGLNLETEIETFFQVSRSRLRLRVPVSKLRPRLFRT